MSNKYWIVLEILMMFGTIMYNIYYGILRQICGVVKCLNYLLNDLLNIMGSVKHYIMKFSNV